MSQLSRRESLILGRLLLARATGERIPTLRELAKIPDVGCFTTVHTAIRRLHALGLIEQSPGKGANAIRVACKFIPVEDL